MTKRAAHRVYPPYGWVALCLLLLQLVNALHFALIPHGFGAGLVNLVHVSRALDVDIERAVLGDATQPAPISHAIAAGSAGCEPETCPLAFSGPHSRPVAPSELSALLSLAGDATHVVRECVVFRCDRVLLRAPKTSPPFVG